MTQTAAHLPAATATAPAATYVLVPPPDYILIPLTGGIVILAGLLIAALFATRIRRAASHEAQQLLETTAQLGDQIERLHAALQVSDTRLAALAARQDEHSRSTQGATSTSYNVAIRMARSGATRQEVMSTCGVTQQEADLVLRLHAADPAARSAA